ncbi:MAG: endolytic transglycosylase MltG [Prevotellaceae bacterium]|jgi:UPF0755 protein|nr:endolytic transglycosylase MltG [Prevotellaceae bacterium]
MTYRKKRVKTLLFAVIAAAFLITGVFGYVFFYPNISLKNGEKAYLLVYPNSTATMVVNNIEKVAEINSKSSFLLAAQLLKYTDKVRVGRYEIDGEMSNLALIRRLRSGRQAPVQLTFNNIRTREQLAGKLSAQLLNDSVTLINLLNDSTFLAPYHLAPATAVSLFIPDTYDVYWNISAKELFDRMYREYQNFWTNDRLAKAAAIPLSPLEVSILASIIEEETNAKTERPMVAGLYINRLKQNMKLQTDPTIKFALGDFGLRRILIAHIFQAKGSPYNTYFRLGLPPGPIRIPSKNGLDAVLNYKQHDYLYMCAKETFDGTHNFAHTYAEHQQNAKKYQQALNARNIR